ncbi:MAG TPA: hypothetical protein GXX20_07385 [Clostridiaceae bacterium]|nr:hypothetical protein [Clostridiaceae bacterium]
MSMRHVRLLSQASAILQRPAACSEWVVPVMPECMPIEARCQGNRGINAVSSLKLSIKILTNSYCKENEKFAYEYLTQTVLIICQLVEK